MQSQLRRMFLHLIIALYDHMAYPAASLPHLPAHGLVKKL